MIKTQNYKQFNNMLLVFNCKIYMIQLAMVKWELHKYHQNNKKLILNNNK